MTTLPTHTSRKDRGRREKKCILATCAIRKLNRKQRHISVVGTGSIVRGFFENLDEKVHLITSQKVISPDDNLSDYNLYFKDLNNKDMVWTLSSISGKAIFKRPGLVAVHVDPNKFNIFRKYTCSLLTHRPLIICDEEREALRNFELDCHVVEDYGYQFSITPYQVMGIANQEAYLVDQNSMKIESVSIYSGTRRGLGAPIAITGGDDGAKAVGAITLDDNEQISFVLFSQIDRSRISSDIGGAGRGHWEHWQGREEQPTGELAGRREEQPTGELAEKREEQPTGELAERREEQPTEELAGRREEQLTGELAERREEQPTGELAERREEQPTEELAGRREEQLTGELAERREEQPAEELAERRAEQPAGELAERREEQPQLKPLEREGECDCVTFTSNNYREEAGQDTINHSDQYASAQALGPVTVLVSDASSSGGKDGVTFTSNYRGEAGQDTTNHSANHYTSDQVLGPSKAKSPVNVMMSFASRSGEKGVVLGMFHLSAWMK